MNVFVRLLIWAVGTAVTSLAMAYWMLASADLDQFDRRLGVFCTYYVAAIGFGVWFIGSSNV